MARTLYLIDGHAQIFRAYYAIRGGMTSPNTGEPTQAIFGFAGMLLKLFDQFKPEYIAMPIDVHGPTFRDKIYPDYKAQRDPPPADFKPQEQRIFEMTEMFGIPILSKQGYEADDVIATFVQKILDDPTSNDVYIRIVSRDKDLEQLLGPRVEMFDIHKNISIKEQDLKAKKGITPHQVIDMLSLIGDTADNIKGAKGIGPKTATQLLNEFGSLEGIYQNIDQIKGKRKEKLLEAKQHMPLNQQLVTLCREVDLPINLNDAQVGKVDVVGLRNLFQTLGFHRHVRDLIRLFDPEPAIAKTPEFVARSASNIDDTNGFPDSLFGHIDQKTTGQQDQTTSGLTYDDTTNAAQSLCTSADDCIYEAITTTEQLEQLVEQLKIQKLISIDTETIGLGAKVPLCGICLAWKPKHGVYIPMRSPTPSEHLTPDQVLKLLRPILEDASLPKCGHNLKYDAAVLRYAGIRLQGTQIDTMIASHLLGYPSHSLDALAEIELQHRMIPISQLIGPRGHEQTTMDQVALDKITPYAAEDADVTLQLAEKLAPKLVAQNMTRLADVEMPLVEVLCDMQTNGIRVDPNILMQQKKEHLLKIEQLKQAIYDAAGITFNLDSTKQLADLLFNQLGLPIIKKGKTGPSTNVEVLEKLINREDLPAEKTRIAELVLQYRQLAKLVNTYMDNLRDSIDPDDGRIHAQFQQLGAATGRLSSNNPNLQNIPIRTEIGRQIRKAFIASPGEQLICADYSQIELRLLAHLSQDAAMLDAFRNNEDIHRAVASRVFNVPTELVTDEQRSRAKIVNFGIVYGITPYGLARRMGNIDIKQAKILIEEYRQGFAGIDRFLKQCVNQAIEKSYVTTILGRRRPIHQINSLNGQTRALGERLAINTVVQGSATADLIKLAMVNLYRRIQRDQLPMKLLVQIHDELILEAPDKHVDAMVKIVTNEMENAMQLTVPLKVDVGVGRDWFHTKS